MRAIVVCSTYGWSVFGKICISIHVDIEPKFIMLNLSHSTSCNVFLGRNKFEQAKNIGCLSNLPVLFCFGVVDSGHKVVGLVCFWGEYIQIIIDVNFILHIVLMLIIFCK
jgi:hypothetical protein